MAKDPAVLFYTSDFLVGTYSMTDAQRGQYICLLCLQHQQGHLPESVMRDAMHGELDAKIMQKYKRDENGLYYNERMEAEADKRKAYTKSRSENRSKKSAAGSRDEHMKMISKTYVQHMENENTSTTLNTQVTKKDVYGSFLSDAEMLTLSRGLNATYDLLLSIGFPDTSADRDRCERMVADYTAEWVQEAIRRTGDAPSNARCWRYVEAILKRWRAAGGMDSGERAKPDDDQRLPPMMGVE